MALRKEQKKIDTVYARDTLRFTKWKDSIVVMRDSVDRWKHDTVKVVEYVQKTDSVIASCTDALNSCALSRKNLFAQLAQMQIKLDAKPTRSCTGSNIVWGLLGAAGGFTLSQAKEKGRER